VSVRGRWLIAVAAIVLVIAVYVVVQEHLRVRVTEESLQPQVVGSQDGGPLAFRVGVTWFDAGWCYGQFQVKATETATHVRVGPVISRTYSAGACAGLGTVNNIAWAPLALMSPIGTRVIVRDSDGAVLPVLPPGSAAASLACKDAIASKGEPAADLSVVSNQVALPTVNALQASVSGHANPSLRMYAKAALFVASGGSFTLIVPTEWIGRLTIGWGNPPGQTTFLFVAGCKATSTQKRWLVFAGGFWVGEPACVPLLIRTPGQEQTVMIGVGAACPGQAPPPPGA
jgi:hypothetical protein